MAKTKYRRKRKRRQTTESAADALARIEASENSANYPVIIDAFTARGIPADEIKPRENVFTYRAWHAKGRQVKKGEKSVRIDVWIEYDSKNEKDENGKPKKKRIRRSVAVFHISQTAERKEGDKAPPRDRQQQDGQQDGGRRGVSSSRLRQLADGMQKKIDEKLNPAIARQNHTARRARIAQGMRQDAYRLQRIQAARRKMADAIDAGTLPDCLIGIYSEDDCGRLTREPYRGEDESEADKQARAWLMDAENEMDERARKEYEREQTLRNEILANPPDGFFPTPADLARRMIELAEIRDGDEVLEPNGGMGDIAELIVSHIADNNLNARLDIVEINLGLCDYLESIGFAPHWADITEMQGEFDRIIMNPPYEKKQDLRHVRHCFNMLKPGGRLVALVSAGFQFRADAETVAFRDWLKFEANCELCEVLEDAFKGSQSKRQTGVRVCLLVLQK